MRVVQIALAAAVLRIILGEHVIDPITAKIWPSANTPKNGCMQSAGDPECPASLRPRIYVEYTVT